MKRLKNTLVNLISGAALLVGLPSLAAAETTPPKPIDHTMPASDAARTLEGWVWVSFSVLGNGKTANIQVIDVRPAGILKSVARSAVEKWTYEPARKDGAKVDWHNMKAFVLFDDPEVELATDESFQARFNAAQVILTAAQFDEAKSKAKDLVNRADTLNEFALADILLARAELGLGDAQAALDRILPATHESVAFLNAEEIPAALQIRYLAEADLGRLAASQITFERLEALAPLPEDHAIRKHANTVRLHLDSDEPLVISGRIGNMFAWHHTPSRRTFTITDATGDIHSLAIRCNQRRAEMAYEPDVDWTLPESWGACEVLVQGGQGIEFKFIEFTPEQ